MMRTKLLTAITLAISATTLTGCGGEGSGSTTAEESSTNNAAVANTPIAPPAITTPASTPSIVTPPASIPETQTETTQQGSNPSPNTSPNTTPEAGTETIQETAPDSTAGTELNVPPKAPTEPASTPDTNALAKVSVLGNAFKGPIDGAVAKITDANGKVLGSANSNKGKFELKDIILPKETRALFIETSGGSYEDEATGKRVDLAGKGLMTVFTSTELQSIANSKKIIALTPETTMMAIITKNRLASGQTAQAAIEEAKTIIQREVISGTNPAMGIPGDKLLMVGDLTATLPANQSEALARNRAISFSYEAESLKLSPAQVFELIGKRAFDLEDGTLDGKKDGITSISIKDKKGVNKKLDNIDQKTNYGLARTRLLNSTIARFSSGNITPTERANLEQLGFNSQYFENLNQNNQTLAENTTTQLDDKELPAFNHLPVLTDEDGNPDDNRATYTLTATPNVDVTINTPSGSWVTPMMRYNGSQLPPVIKAKRGDTMTLNLVNNLSAETTIHWHGFKIPGDQDGGPDFPVAAGNSKTYSFPMVQPAAPLWFHPHPDMKTGEQVYRGLAGVYLLEDAITKKLATDKKIPSGKYDIPILVQDRRFKDEHNGKRELAYMDKEMDSDGMLGDRILVNGAVLPKLDVETRQYRFKLYNVSNARSYDFALNDGSSFKVVGTDGGLLPQPVEVDHIMLGAAERAEIVIDFGKYSVGEKVMLISKAFNGSPMMGMMSGDMNSGSGGSNNTTPSNNPMSRQHGEAEPMNGLGNESNNGTQGEPDSGRANNTASTNAEMNTNPPSEPGNSANTRQEGESGNNMIANGMRMDIMRFDITSKVADDVTLYTALPDTAEINSQRLTAADANKTRNFVMTMAMGNMNGGMGSGPNGGGMGSGPNGGGMGSGSNGSGMGGMSFVINGKAFDINRIDELINLADGDTEIWSIQNRSPMAHPFHAHAIQWQILSRNGKPAEGIDLGWKDTVLVQPGETVNFIGRFDPAVNYGNYMYHCHILEHEDAGMMGFFRIQ